MTTSSNPYLTEREAADLLRRHHGTLANWRSRGKGPAYHKVEGTVLYSRRELVRWIEAGRVKP